MRHRTLKIIGFIVRLLLICFIELDHELVSELDHLTGWIVQFDCIITKAVLKNWKKNVRILRMTEHASFTAASHGHDNVLDFHSIFALVKGGWTQKKHSKETPVSWSADSCFRFFTSVLGLHPETTTTDSEQHHFYLVFCCPKSFICRQWQVLTQMQSLIMCTS